MIKREIAYTDYNNVERKESFYFNLSEAELMEMEFGTSGGFTEMLKKLVETQDQPTIMKVLKDFILKSYGVKSPDGREFIKSDELSRSFYQTKAYSVLLLDLLKDTNEATKFFNGIVPESLSKESAKALSPVNQ